MSNKPFVTNAADESQVKEAATKAKSKREQELNDISAILSSKEGRRFFWRLLTHCSVFQSIWEQSARIHYNAGKQDVGHFLQGEIVLANQNSYMEMMKENSKGE